MSTFGVTANATNSRTTHPGSTDRGSGRKHAALEQDSTRERIEHAADLRVSAADGVPLATDLYRPAVATRRPAVLLRTYLGKARHRDEALGWARAGYVCCVQDVRGRYASGGQWRPYASEQSDGGTTVRWLAAHPWCDARIVVAGASYGAFTAWAAALGGQPHVRAVISSVPSMRPVDMPHTQDGVLPLLGHLAWWLNHGSGRHSRPNRLAECLREDPTLLEHLPLAMLPERIGLPSTDDESTKEEASARECDLDGWLEAAEAAGDTDPIPDAALADLDVASMHIGGWHDPFVRETLRLHALVGRDRDPRPPRRLVIGPWTHEMRVAEAARYGERDYGPRARFALGQVQARWLDSLFGDAGFGGDRDRATVFVTGANDWIDVAASAEPVAERRLYATQEGVLAATPVAEEGSTHFRYDPADPFSMRRTPIDERDLDDRRDVVRFTTAPLESPLRWIGGGEVELFAASAAERTDWMARLLEVAADGRLLFLSYGIIDARRHLRVQGTDYAPRQVMRYRIRLAPMGIRIPAGHRLRLEVTSSAFPSHARNLGRGDRLHGTRAHPARQTVHWGGARPTQVRLACMADAPPAQALRLEASP